MHAVTQPPRRPFASKERVPRAHTGRTIANGGEAWSLQDYRVKEETMKQRRSCIETTWKTLGTLTMVTLLAAGPGCKSDKVATAERAIATEKVNVAMQGAQIRAGQEDVRESLRDINQHQQQLDQAQVGLTAAYDEYSLRIKERLALVKLRIGALPLSVDPTQRTNISGRYDALAASVASTNAVTVPNWEKFRTETSTSFESLERDLTVVEQK